MCLCIRRVSPNGRLSHTHTCHFSISSLTHIFFNYSPLLKVTNLFPSISFHISRFLFWEYFWFIWGFFCYWSNISIFASAISIVYIIILSFTFIAFFLNYSFVLSEVEESHRSHLALSSHSSIIVFDDFFFNSFLKSSFFLK